MIYFVQAGEGGPIKIGKSNNPEMWLKKNQGSHYNELRIIQLIPGDSELKAEIKKALSEYMIRGDWFKPTPNVIDYIREIKKPEFFKGRDRGITFLYRSTEGSQTELCPFCGMCHSHGGGDGFRVAHCMKDRAETFIVAEDGTKLFRKHGYIIKTRDRNIDSEFELLQILTNAL